jgi:polyphosphate kinase
MAKTAKETTKALAKRVKHFDIDDPELPAWIEDGALVSGGFPYDKRLKREVFEHELGRLQSELLKLQQHVQSQGERIVILLEGRDAAGKGTAIGHFLEHMNTRHARSVALNKPTETERGQWYFQRYVAHLPTAGDIVLFDRSWYNRAGVERVMGFCSKAQVEAFLGEVPDFEALLVRDGVKLFKLFLTLGREMQLKRFHERRHDPFKRWKLSDIDLASMAKWDDYSAAQADLFRHTHREATPWTVIRSNDQRRSRLEAIRTVLHSLDYEGRDKKAIGKPDPLLVGSGQGFFDS